VFNGFLSVVVLRVGFSKQLVSLDLLLNVVCFFAQLEELLSVLHSVLKFTLGLVYHTDLLVTVSLDDLILGSLSYVQTLFEELK
jgi:hypothetical protein